MSRVKEGNRRLTFDIPEHLHKELYFLAVEHDTSITYEICKRDFGGIREESEKRKVKKERAFPLQRKHPMSKLKY